MHNDSNPVSNQTPDSSDMADSMYTPATHPLSEVNIDALETQKFDLPFTMVQRSNSTRSTRSDKSVSSISSSVDNSLVNTPVTKSTTAPPHFIILSLWPHATDSQIASYIAGYEDLYPSAKVLLLRSSSWRTTSPDLDALTTTLTASLPTHPSEKPPPPQPILLHLFGHTAALNACALLRAYRARACSPLDVRAIVSDTEPALTLADLHNTLLTSPATLLSLLLTLFFTTISAALALFSYDDATHRIRADLTNAALLPASTRKCFVFAAQEVMFSWCEGQGFGGAAERREWSVKRDRVDGRGRWCGEKERYWLGVEGVWEGE